ncbi:Protein pelota like protein [Cucumispora dikerogammari]|nr:Protein pelota like protein [Cucumispora dikerogammari]
MIFHSNNIKDPKQSSLRISPETNGDIYRIYNLIDPSDTVTAFSSRKIKLENGTIFRKSSVFMINVEKIDIDLLTGALDIKGRILNQVENVKAHSYHTLNIQKNDTLTIQKNTWNSISQKIVNEMNTKIIEMLFFIKRPNSVFILSVTENTIKQIAKFDIKKPKSIKMTLKNIKIQDSHLIVSVNTKDSNDLIRNLIETSLLSKYVFVNLQTNIESLNELINYCILTPSILNRLHEVQFVVSFKEMNDFLDLFNSNYEEKRKLVSVGFDEIQVAIDFSAVKSLLICSDLFKSCNLDERVKIEEIERNSAQLNIKLFVLPVSHHLGEKLKAVGGIAAILTFPVDGF